jgi:hypothetical protein
MSGKDIGVHRLRRNSRTGHAGSTRAAADLGFSLVEIRAYFQLSLFLRTISNSELLCSFVVAASFECRLPDQEESVSRALELLAPSLQYLHLTPARYNPDSTGTYLYPLTSLEIQSRHLAADYANRIVDKDQVYSLFCIPTLDSLSLIGVQSWGCLDMWFSLPY